MGKRKAVEEKPKELIGVSVNEYWDLDMLSDVYELKHHSYIDRVLCDAIKLTSLTKSQPTNAHVNRIYCLNSSSGQLDAHDSLAQLPSWIRRVCTFRNYTSLDIKNCGMTIMTQLLEKTLGKSDELLDYYISNSKSVINNLRTNKVLSAFTKQKLKYLVVSAFYGKNEYPYIEFLAKMEERGKIAHNLLKQHKDYFTIDDDMFLKTVVCYQKSKLLINLVKICSKTLEVGVILDASILIRKQDFNVDHIMKELFNESKYKLRLKESRIELSPEDVQKLYGEKEIGKFKNVNDKVTYLMRYHAQKHDLKRRDGYIMERYQGIPGVYTRTTERKNYINQVAREYHCYQSTSFTALEKWFDNHDHEMFSILTKDKLAMNKISFKDGVFDIVTLEFTPWEQYEGQPPINDHYFDQKYETKPTPLWDSILSTQLARESDATTYLTMTKMTEACIGRLFYEVNKYDNWQIQPHIMGDAGTGKSLIAMTVREMFPKGSVGTISGTTETQFALQALYQKKVIIVSELDRHFHEKIQQSDWQEMVSGNLVSIPLKHGMAISDFQWKIALFTVGNVRPGYNDDAGSYSRRLLVIYFLKLVMNKDPNMFTKIIASELVSIMLRCIRTYREVAERYKGQDFWTFAPEEMQENKEEVKVESNYLAEFISRGNSTHVVMKVPGQITSLNDAQQAYFQYMREVHPSIKTRPLTRTERSVFAMNGFRENSMYICKLCLKPALVSICKEHYDACNRTKRIQLHDMVLQRRSNM